MNGSACVALVQLGCYQHRRSYNMNVLKLHPYFSLCYKPLNYHDCWELYSLSQQTQNGDIGSWSYFTNLVSPDVNKLSTKYSLLFICRIHSPIPSLVNCHTTSTGLKTVIIRSKEIKEKVKATARTNVYMLVNLSQYRKYWNFLLRSTLVSKSTHPRVSFPLMVLMTNCFPASKFRYTTTVYIWSY